MANSILDSHMPTTSNTVLNSHGWPNNTSGNALLVSHGDPYTGGGGSFAISSASAVNATGILTINGAQFGTKATLAPVYFQPFVGLANGLAATHASVGLDWGADGYGYPQTSDADGIGGGCLTMPVLGATNSDDDWFMHLGLDLGGSHQEIFVSQWQKFVYTSGTLSTTMQLKGIRAGRINPGNPTAEGSYGYTPSMGGSLWITPGGNQTTAASNCYQWFRETGNSTEIGNFEQDHDPETAPYRTPNNTLGAEPYPRVTTAWGQWFQQEVHFKMNDYGSTNGIQRLYGNAKKLIELTHANPRISADSDNAFQWVGLWPGLDHTLGADFHARLSRIYVDTTLARVFLGNASTYAACTGAFLCPPTAWGATQITASDCKDRPSGYDYAYVVRSDGTMSNGVLVTFT